ncbi:MAG: hypothetical protein ABJA78_06355 [Ferruginibacter sp.]
MSEEENILPEDIPQEQSTGETISSDEPVVETEQLITHNSQLSTPDMEVHHHPKVEKKNFKEYLLEGLMIFLAVTLGFFAENYSEHVTDAQREKEFAVELYAELKSDSTVAANMFLIRGQKLKDMDYLSSYFKDSSLTALPKAFYPAYTTSLYLINSYSFEPKDGILEQLKSSGSLRYFKSAALQKLLGDISVCINNMRYRNEQEYQFFASPIKSFMLEHYDFSWLNRLRNGDDTIHALDLLNNYRNSNRYVDGKILNLLSLDKSEVGNMIQFYKQMLVSTQSLQMNNYIIANKKILQLLRTTYSLENE